MTLKEQLAKEIEQAPEAVLEELLDFARFLRSKAENARNDLAILSESALAADWLKPEEDVAWSDL